MEYQSIMARQTVSQLQASKAAKAAILLVVVVFTLTVAAAEGGVWNVDGEREGKCLASVQPTDPPVSVSNIVSRPVLFMIGAQKAGTTYLFKLLQRHPNIYPLPFITYPGQPQDYDPDMAAKEPHVFDSTRGLPPSKLALYSAETRPGWVLDATPDYMDTPIAACRIHRYFTNAKFLVVLRDPVARAVSAWTMVQRNNIFHNQTTRKWLGLPHLVNEVQREINYLTNIRNCSTASERPGLTNWGDCLANHFPFLQCISKYKKSADDCMFGFVWKGLYARQLEFWLSLFPSNRFHVVSFYDLKHNTEKIIDGVYSFLNLTHEVGQPKPHLHPEMKLRKAVHTYVDDQKRAKWCEYQELRRCITTLAHFYAQPQHHLAELLKKYQWTHAMSAAQQMEYICQVKEFADIA